MIAGIRGWHNRGRPGLLGQHPIRSTPLRGPVAAADRGRAGLLRRSRLPAHRGGTV